MMKNKTAAMKKVMFNLKAEPGAAVFVAGTFNNWDAAREQLLDLKGDGNYSCTMTLAPGDYEYKFKVDHSWLIDQNNPHFTQNNFGTLNSILEVR
ncbi:MAG: glycogen-binding domain-containing protein [Victivallales bacterium]|nr:glycogen-binding domain-containing protein [Victivallales bacterium]